MTKSSDFKQSISYSRDKPSQINENRVYLLFATPEEVHCESLRGMYKSITELINGVDGMDKKIFTKWANEVLDFPEDVSFPVNLKEFGGNEPNYDNEKIIDPLSCSFCVESHGMIYSVHVVDLPDKGKYDIHKCQSCLCFDQPFHITRKGEPLNITIPESTFSATTTFYQ